MLKLSEKVCGVFLMNFDGVWKNVKKNEFGGRFINIGLEHVAVAAARVCDRPPRCSNKGVQKRRCL